jgi:hypothetical protein
MFDTLFNARRRMKRDAKQLAKGTAVIERYLIVIKKEHV